MIQKALRSVTVHMPADKYIEVGTEEEQGNSKEGQMLGPKKRALDRSTFQFYKRDIASLYL